MNSVEAASGRAGRLRVGFAGTPEFAEVALRALLEEGFEVPIVLTQPDRPAGRGLKLQPSAVKALALERRLPALADAPIVKAWAGLYEMTPDAMPIIGPTGPEGMYTIGGFSGHGFQHSPAAGRILADVIAGRDPGMDLAPFSLERFEGASTSVERGVV